PVGLEQDEHARGDPQGAAVVAAARPLARDQRAARRTRAGRVPAAGPAMWRLRARSARAVPGGGEEEGARGAPAEGGGDCEEGGWLGGQDGGGCRGIGGQGGSGQ